MSKSANEPWAGWAEQMQKWMATPGASNPFGVASGGMPGSGMPGGFANPFAAFTSAPLDPQSIMKSIDPEEIDRRIKDMRAVEGWLKLSLSTLEMSIKTMEMQRDAYASLRSMGESATKAATASSNFAKSAAKRASQKRASSRK
ncbi:MAG: hypothetical protein EAZ21_10365 [Betaproteobacteria bacterium]|nr:MAG: hypothetical protein EAZ21_10365 [Betaproteobacteria bacterium]